jgi:hypothetical protein
MSNESDTKPGPPNSRSLPETIGFRLKGEALGVLCARAEQSGASPHDLARQYVLDLLSAEQERAGLRDAVGAMANEITELRSVLSPHVNQAALQQALVAIRNEITELREDFAVAVESLLTLAGQVDEKRAHAWVQKNLRKN